MRLLLILCSALFSIIGVAKPHHRSFYAKQVIADPSGQGGTGYLLLEVCEVNAQGITTKSYPAVAKLGFLKGLDPNFGESGVVSLEGIDGWSEVDASRIKVMPDGTVYVAGKVTGTEFKELSAQDRSDFNDYFELSKEQQLTQELVRAEQMTPKGEHPQRAVDRLDDEIETLIEKIASRSPSPKKQYRQAKDKTQHAFVTKISKEGKLDPKFGDGGTRIVMGLLDTDRDVVGGLAIQPNGNVAFAASVHTGADRADTVIARLNSDGSDQDQFPHHGKLRIPARKLPGNQIGGGWEPVDLHWSPTGFRVVGRSVLPWREESTRFIQIDVPADAKTEPNVEKLASVRYLTRPGESSSGLVYGRSSSSDLWIVKVKKDDLTKDTKLVVRRHPLKAPSLSPLASSEHSEPAADLRVSIDVSFRSIQGITIGDDGDLIIEGSKDSGKIGRVVVSKNGTVQTGNMTSTFDTLYQENANPVSRCSQAYSDTFEQALKAMQK